MADDPLRQGLGILGPSQTIDERRQLRTRSYEPFTPMPPGYNRLPGILAGETPTFNRPSAGGGLGATSEFQDISEQFRPFREGVARFANTFSRQNLPYLGIAAGNKLNEALFGASAPIAAALGYPETAQSYQNLADQFGSTVLPELVARPEAEIPVTEEDTIAAVLQKLSAPSTERPITPGPQDAPERLDLGLTPPEAPEKPEEAPEVDVKKGQEIAVEEGLKAGIDEYLSALGDDAIPQPKSIDEYKDIFAQATGIDISGKPDKSQALMAFGLALMQNRAGKGFNVGNMLRSIGEAGEAAMPALAEARKEARAGQLAAGQYALGQLKEAQDSARATRVAAGEYALEQLQAGRSASAALAAEKRAHAREIQLELLKMEADAAEAAREGIKFENTSSMEVQPGSNIKVTTGIDSQGNSIYVKPSLEVGGVISGYNRYTKGQQLTNELIETLRRIDEAGPAGLQRIYSDVAGTLSNFGIDLPGYDPSAASDPAKADNLKLAIILGFKRAITQESQVSDKDTKIMEESIGQFTAMAPIAKVIDAAMLFNEYLSSQKAYYEDQLTNFSNPRYYAGRNDEFVATQEQILNGIIDQSTYIVRPGQGDEEGVVGSVDLTSGGQ